VRTLYFFGDSICFGQYISTHQVWTTRVSASLEGTPSFQDVLTQVTAVNGETSREALGRLQHCVTSHQPSVVWIQFGLNDSNYWKSDNGLPRVSPASFRANLAEMTDRCLATGTERVVLATNHVVTKRLAHDPKNDRYAENAQKYNNEIRAVAATFENHRVLLVDIERRVAESLGDPASILLADGVHLNLYGHKTYHALALPAVQSALESI
jgi:lysophospholipase L1-like esterase